MQLFTSRFLHHREKSRSIFANKHDHSPDFFLVDHVCVICVFCVFPLDFLEMSIDACVYASFPASDLPIAFCFCVFSLAAHPLSLKKDFLLAWLSNFC